jgi:periplasmic protein CpxP/Spy
MYLRRKRKIMKKLIGLILVLVGSSVLFAQQGRDPKKIAAVQSEKMKEVLVLNDEQYASVRSINEKYAEQIMEAKSRSAKGRSSELQSLRGQRAKEINNVLTPEQQKKWSQHKQEAKDKKASRQDGRGRSLTNLQKELALSDDQVSRIKEAESSLRKNIETIRSDSGLPEAQKKDKLRALRNEYQSQIQTILNAEQNAKLKAIKAERRANRRSRP